MSPLPQTPPRPKRVTIQTTTPVELPALKRMMALPLKGLPQKLKQIKRAPKQLGMHTPEYTPKRKRKFADDIFALLHHESHHDRFNFGVLLPLPLTIGSGRVIGRKDAGHLAPSMPLPEAHHAFILKISPDFLFEEEVGPELVTPNTPGPQMITEELVDQWHGKLFKQVDSSSEEDNDSDDDWGSELKKPKQLKNPFVESSSSSIVTQTKRQRRVNPFALSPVAEPVDYLTHLEMVNNRTGERKVVRLSAAQQKHKPKRLDFSNI